MAITMYWYPKCGTCQKAKKWLDENEVTYTTIHMVEEPLAGDYIAQLHKKSGLPLKKFFNTSGMKYRELGLKNRLPEMSDEEQYALLASDGMLVKRPLLTDSDNVTLGFNEEQFARTWKK
ncbi:MAG: arsenate reductase family protein [Bacilli bacterium]